VDEASPAGDVTTKSVDLDQCSPRRRLNILNDQEGETPGSRIRVLDQLGFQKISSTNLAPQADSGESPVKQGNDPLKNSLGNSSIEQLASLSN
jgi:hypothetical protein